MNETYVYNNYKDFEIYNISLGNRYIVATAYSNDMQTNSILVYRRFVDGGSPWLWGGVDGNVTDIGYAKRNLIQQVELNGVYRIFMQQYPGRSLQVFEIGNMIIDVRNDRKEIINNARLGFDGSENNRSIDFKDILYYSYPEGEGYPEESSSLLWLWILLGILGALCFLILIGILLAILLSNKNKPGTGRRNRKRQQKLGNKSTFYEDDYDYRNHEFRSEQRMSRVL